MDLVIFKLCVSIHIHRKMASKTISVSEEAYGTLARERIGNESFSKIVIRLSATRGDIMSYAGTWKDIPEKDIARMKAGISEMRKKATDSLVKR